MARDMNVGPAAEKKLEQYGVWVKVEPRPVAAKAAAGVPKAPALTDEEEQLLGELDTDLQRSEGDAAAGTEDLPELELEELEETGDSVELPLSEGRPREGRFDDLEALEEELGTSATSPRALGSAAQQPEALSRIEEELRSIRSDLTQLKRELADLRRAPAAAAEGPAATSSRTGFFEEEDDDTIALTGDELDNILNTAEITEESAGSRAVAADSGSLEAAEPAAAAVVEELPDLEAEESPAVEAPAEIELEGLAAPPAAQPEAGDLTLDLEGIPELEEDLPLEELGAAEAAAPSPGETPAPELEAVADLEELPAEEDAASARTTPPLAAPVGIEDVDLDALTATPGATEESPLSADDLSAADLAELESVAEEAAPEAASAIEIDFEQQPEAAPQAPAEAAAPAKAAAPAESSRPAEAAAGAAGLSEDLKEEIRKVLKYMDNLLEALPENKIQEFASSDYFVMYHKLFEDLGLGS